MLLTKEVEVTWRLSNKLHYESKGYTFTNLKDKFIVKVEDLFNSSTVRVDIKCDNCGKILDYVTYYNYKKCVKKDGKYYCQKCGAMLFTGKALKLPDEEIQKIINEKLGWRILDIKIKNGATHVDLIDDFGYIYCDVNIHHIKRNEKPRFVQKSNKSTIQNIKLWCKLNNKPFELISDKYEGTDKKLKWKCLNEICLEIFELSWHDISQNVGCQYCVGKKVGMSNCLATKRPDLAVEWHPTKNGELTPYDVTCSARKDIWWQCEKRHEWNIVMYSRVNNNSGCPICNQSKGEKKIKEILDNNNIQYIPHKDFEDLVGTGGGKLSYDFYLIEYNLLIEYQGEYHDGTANNQTQEKFEYQQEHDKRKREYAKNYNIDLLEIWYWDFNNIEKILDEQFKNYMSKEFDGKEVKEIASST
jgi:predicted RNA-binding Zn-ribbon protein involved in translation (DUF1610 family)